MTKRIPVTVLSGYLGSGKTTMMNHVLQNKKDLRVAVIVNDMSEINIDAELIANGSGISRTEEKFVELSMVVFAVHYERIYCRRWNALRS